MTFEWSCSVCTYLHLAPGNRCVMCGNLRNASTKEMREFLSGKTLNKRTKNDSSDADEQLQQENQQPSSLNKISCKENSVTIVPSLEACPKNDCSKTHSRVTASPTVNGTGFNSTSGRLSESQSVHAALQLSPTEYPAATSAARNPYTKRNPSPAEAKQPPLPSEHLTTLIPKQSSAQSSSTRPGQNLATSSSVKGRSSSSGSQARLLLVPKQPQKPDPFQRKAIQAQQYIPGPVPIDSQAAKDWIYPVHSKFPIRTYQLEIAETSIQYNTLVSLPTGLGKTLIAAVVLYNFYRWFPQGKVIFLAPTLPLVDQQVKACYQIMGIPAEHTAVLNGKVLAATRETLWQERRVFFCTPQTVEKDMETGRCPASRVVCLVLDEAHKATGNFSYTKVVELCEAAGAHLRILGLSATPGAKVQQVQKVIDALRITRLEARSEEEVKEYIHERHNEIIVVKKRSQCHEIEQQLNALIQPIMAKLRANTNIRQKIAASDYTLTSFCIHRGRQHHHQTTGDHQYDGYFVAAQKLIDARANLYSHGIGSVRGKLLDLQNNPQKSVLSTVVKSPGFIALMEAVINASSGKYSQETAQDKKLNNPKLSKLDEILQEHFNREAASGKTTRAIVFSQWRESVAEIVDVLSLSRPLIRPRYFVGQSSGSQSKNKGTGMKGMNQKVQQQAIVEFQEGIFNVLVCTCIGEEGLDIGEVDLIVNYDTLRSPIRMIQRVGRTGRKRDGRVVCLVSEGQEQKDMIQSKNNERSLQRALRRSDNFKLRPNQLMFPAPPKLFTKNVEVMETLRLSQVGGHSVPQRKKMGFTDPADSKNWQLTAKMENIRLLTFGPVQGTRSSRAKSGRFPALLRRKLLRCRAQSFASAQWYSHKVLAGPSRRLLLTVEGMARAVSLLPTNVRCSSHHGDLFPTENTDSPDRNKVLQRDWSERLPICAPFQRNDEVQAEEHEPDMDSCIPHEKVEVEPLHSSRPRSQVKNKKATKPPGHELQQKLHLKVQQPLSRSPANTQVVNKRKMIPSDKELQQTVSHTRIQQEPLYKTRVPSEIGLQQHGVPEKAQQEPVKPSSLSQNERSKTPFIPSDIRLQPSICCSIRDQHGQMEEREDVAALELKLPTPQASSSESEEDDDDESENDEVVKSCTIPQSVSIRLPTPPPSSSESEDSDDEDEALNTCDSRDSVVRNGAFYGKATAPKASLGELLNSKQEITLCGDKDRGAKPVGEVEFQLPTQESSSDEGSDDEEVEGPSNAQATDMKHGEAKLARAMQPDGMLDSKMVSKKPVSQPSDAYKLGFEGDSLDFLDCDTMKHDKIIVDPNRGKSHCFGEATPIESVEASKSQETHQKFQMNNSSSQATIGSLSSVNISVSEFCYEVEESPEIIRSKLKANTRNAIMTQQVCNDSPTQGNAALIDTPSTSGSAIFTEQPHTPVSPACPSTHECLDLLDTPSTNHSLSQKPNAVLKTVNQFSNGDDPLIDTRSVKGSQRHAFNKLSTMESKPTETFIVDLVDTPSDTEDRASRPSETQDEIADDIVCLVCQSGDSTDQDPIVLCDGVDGRECEIAIHASCYSLEFAVIEMMDQWRCDPCEQRLQSKTEVKAACFVCQGSSGALKYQKAASLKHWVHPYCMTWSDEDATVVCSICSFPGATICDFPSCSLAAHPHCAQDVLVRRPWLTVIDTLQKCNQMFCPKHRHEDHSYMRWKSYEEDSRVPTCFVLPSSRVIRLRSAPKRVSSCTDQNSVSKKRIKKAASIFARQDSTFGDLDKSAEVKRQRLKENLAKRHRGMLACAFIDTEAVLEDGDDFEGDDLEAAEALRIEEEEELAAMDFINDSTQLGYTQDELDRLDPEEEFTSIHRRVDMEHDRKHQFATPVFNRRMKEPSSHSSDAWGESQASGGRSSLKGLGNCHFIRSVIEHARNGGDVNEIEEFLNSGAFGSDEIETGEVPVARRLECSVVDSNPPNDTRSVSLTEEQKAIIQRKRLEALAIRQKKA